ncbi:carbamoyl phosphate synthase small subunit [Lentilactobacillus kefiri]|uniref:Carbamoyl phosphate synthase small chain n=2 Tax=Lentilactobacillus kefiri TaxID=33962 RepID=A0A8E1RIW6_LENKE|nr:carbamoyl phosphate synthase small subunit [Lentilactobacillus kefiri]KRL66800.1 carbamoyl-phosphate synthase small subunit [Lentilactobacillus parakefiri DSM 10551]MDF4143301.1 carbamoyl phosphate synthase small subunit [Lactobacillus kefiranofaciens]KRM51432.1 carbamoyl-phosphate synthase small subunit [Lentilactobacillus kefiri DSM 20587 = JCM 5818]MCJ2162806.1 carbamoyl phosphate synthase small subunit [Lentilactobacillus kefiri]MCP9370204.1 carbamoyl phosphate synthase small subunit [L
MKKYLTLENGDVFVGEACGDLGAEIDGELVFTTSMTGYQETLTDPSYKDQIISFTYPLIGNYGISLETSQSDTVQAAAVIVKEMTDQVFHYQSVISLDAFLKQSKVPAISGIDTRQLTKIIRRYGTMKASLTNQPVTKQTEEDRQASIIKSATLSAGDAKNAEHVVVVDFGVKDNIVKSLQRPGIDVTVVTPESTFEDIANLHPTGILLSNGPGDPTDYSDFLPVIQKLQDNFPLFGICLGHQLLALANGAKTYKMTFGHRGINHPVKNVITGDIYITSQNHGYAVDVDSVDDTPLEVTALEVNDKTCEGLRYPGRPVFSVQYHPEAAPGPHDANKLFDKFIDMMHVNGGVH